MGKLNFRGYLISQFYPTREIRENLMHAKDVFYSMTWMWDAIKHVFVSKILSLSSTKWYEVIAAAAEKG